MLKLVSLSCIFALLSWYCPLLVTSQCLTENDQIKGADPNLEEIQDFNIELFKRLVPHDSNKNFVFSPYSIWNALLLAYFGSAGNTEEQFKQVLRVGDKISALAKWRQLEMLYAIRQDTTSNNTFVLSNRIYFDESVAVRYCIENILHNELHQLDFMNDPHGCADIINDFVSIMTQGHIKRLVSAQDVQNAFLVLVNAAYFRGAWEYPFDRKHTKPVRFLTFSGEEIQVPMMYKQYSYNYSYNEDLGVSMLELPYSGQDIAMYILLPDEEGEIYFDAALRGLNSSIVSQLVENMYEINLNVYLPKFSIESLVEEALMTALYGMGLKNAFFSYKANFLDFSFNPNIKLDHSIHKAFINVDEKGTEAGAATAFIANKIGTSEFVCNRPFIFAIRDNVTKNLLFLGVYRKPKKSQPNQEPQYATENPQSKVTEEKFEDFGIKG